MEKTTDIHQTKKAQEKTVLGDSLVKNVKKWELLDANSKAVTKHFSGATINDMKSYIQRIIYQINLNIFCYVVVQTS